jgi:carboxylate-amine ligase
VTDKPRYHNLAEDDRQVFREQIVFGCHMHVGIEDRQAAVQTMNRVRPWPTAGMPQSFASPARGGFQRAQRQEAVVDLVLAETAR